MTELEATSVVNTEEFPSSDEKHQHPRSHGPSRKRKAENFQRTSCELCKARKVKCDRAEPVCSWCARHNRHCVYLQRQKPGSRIQFGLELDVKINRIEALLQSLDRRVEEHISSDSLAATTPVLPDISSQSFHPFPGTGQPNEIDSSAAVDSRDENLQEAECLCGEQLPQRRLQDAIYPPVRAMMGSLDQATSPQLISELRSPSLSFDRDLPSQEIVYTLVDLYFKYVNTWCPILDRKMTFAGFFGSTSLGEADRVLLHAIVATTLRFLKDSRLSQKTRLHHHYVSKHIVEMYALQHTSVEALKALVILAIDALGTSEGAQGWNLLAIIIQNIVQLGLCTETSIYLLVDRPGSCHVMSPRPESWVEDEGRRRLCWMAYILDRYATLGTSKVDFMLDDRKMQRCLPSSYDLFSKNVPIETRSYRWPEDKSVDKAENLGSFSYHCEVLRILSRVHVFLQKPLDFHSAIEVEGWRNTYQSLDAALSAWLRDLPSEYSKVSALCHPDPASRVANWFMLHSAFVTAVVHLHSSAAYPTVWSPNFAPSHLAMQRCLSAVQSLGDIAQAVLDANSLDLLGPPFAFSLWVAARLLLVHAAMVGSTVDSRIEFFIKALSYMGQYWELADHYAKVLARVIQKEKCGEISYMAMRKSAHSLVTLTTATRRSGVERTSTHMVSPSELDYIDIFDFFNYPKVAEANVQNHYSGVATGHTNEGFRGASILVHDPEVDWLDFGRPLERDSIGGEYSLRRFRGLHE